MFWALETVIGPGDFNEYTRFCWVKIFSGMLRVIVPVAVAHELANNEAQLHRVIDQAGSFAYLPSDKSTVAMCPVMPSVKKEEQVNKA